MKLRLRNIFTVLLMLLFTVAAAIPVKAGGDASVLYGTMEYYSTVNDWETLSDIYHYSDEWFFSSSAERNDDLALVSMQLIAAVSDESAEGLGGQFLNALGFTDVSFIHADAEDRAVCNYLYAKKQIADASESAELIAVVILSDSFDSETSKLGWIQNFTVNTDRADAEHGGFADAADQVISDIAALSEAGSSKYWVMGASRGGALASLISVRLPAAASIAEDDIFTYTFESPAVVNKDAASSAGANIHNYYTSDDPVTYVPPWGMSTYGNRYDLNTDEINALLPKELEKVGSTLAPNAADRSSEYVREIIDEILSVLESAVSSRQEYSLLRREPVVDEGIETVMEYSYQDILVSLMNVIFGMSGEGIDAGVVEEHLADLYEPVCALVSGINTGNSQDYYDAATGLMKFLDDTGISLPLSKTELYGLLKLAGAALVNADYVPEEDMDRGSAVGGYLEPALMLVIFKDQLIFSHHFETVIARLRILAPALKLDDIAFETDPPQAGDDAGKLTEELKTYLEANGLDHVSLNGSWNTEGETLPENQICYFDLELSAEALEADDSLSVTINGESPVQPLSIENTGTGCVIRGTWKFVIGIPSEVSVSFDAGGIRENPETVSVNKGTKLSEVLELTVSERAEKDGKKYVSRDWRDENGTSWDELYADDDLTLYCIWAQVIDNVNIGFTPPKAGEELSAPVLLDDIPCHIEIAYVMDENFDDAESFEEGMTYTIAFMVVADDDSCIFDTEEDEWGTLNYLGTAFINGEEESAMYEEDEMPYLYISHNFTVSAEEEPEDEEPVPSIEYTVTEAPSEWTRGSRSGVRIVVKRNTDDSSCFAHFRSAEIDGKALSSSDYTAEAGSTVLTLPAQTMNRLSAGEHTVTLVFDDGKAETKLTVREAPSGSESADTADNNNIALWTVSLAASAALSLILLIARVRAGKKA